MVDIEGIVRTAPSPITSVTQQSVEISVIRMYCISQAKLCPPLLIDDASRADPQEYIEAGLVPPTTVAVCLRFLRMTFIGDCSACKYQFFFSSHGSHL